MQEGSLSRLLSGDYMPHGMCYGWEPSILWISILSDLLIAASYFSIPFAILWFIRKKDIRSYRSIYVLFALFIFLCGLSHLFGIVTIFKGLYGYQALIKLATAVVSFITAVVIFNKLPLALTIPTSAELDDAHKLADELRFFQSLSEFSPIGLMLVDQHFNIRLVNEKLCKLFEYQESELISQPVNILLEESIRDIHVNFMHGYLNDPTDRYRMNMGRLVQGVTRSGKKIPLEINLSTRKFLGEVHIYVSIEDVTDKHQTHEQLHKTLARLERITDATEDGLWEWNIVNNEVWQSRQHLRKIGQPEDATPNFSLWEQHIHPEYRERTVAKIWDFIEHKNNSLAFEYLGMSETGEYEWFRSRGKITYSQKGQPILMAGSLMNIQNLKRNEIELVNKTKYLEKVLNRSINGLYIYDFESQLNTYINEEYSHITGYSLEDLKLIESNKQFIDLFHPDEQEMILNHMSTVKSSKDGEIFQLQYRFKHKDGHWVWCLSHDSVFSMNQDGEAKEMLGTFIDISAIKESEILHNKLSKDFKNTFELAAVGVSHVSLVGNLVKVNKKVCEFLGYSEEELLNCNFQSITYCKDLDIDLENVARLLSGVDDYYAIEKRYIHKNGEIIWSMLTVSLVRNEKGEPDYFIAVIEDIQNRKSIEKEREKLNQELKRSNDQLSRFAYSASHDMQEPLRKITTFSTSLLGRLDNESLDDNSRFELKRISNSAIRMKNMIQRLLELSRASQTELHSSMVDLQSLVDEVEDQLAVILAESHTKILVPVSGEIYGDRTVLGVVFQNLIKNAIKYRSPDRDPIIEVLYKEKNDCSVIIIKDNGAGFDSRYKADIFEPFKRLVSQKEVDGSGMGLSICKQLVSLHGGDMQADGEVGVGAIFTINLPLKKDRYE